MNNIEINGKKVKVEAGAMIIEIADKLGVQIPRFCYHKKLSIAANCRMCLVEVEKSAKPLPACATPITEGMKIWTHSPKALLAQKSVMEFLLINHPLDCPICDQGGECELQDLSMGYGSDVSRFNEGKRTVKDKNIGPLISTDMTRCIQCTRCVRFGTEVAGVRELGATGRGELMEIGTYIERSVDSEVSGNIIDLCPVGALTSKPYRFLARGWELTQTPSIAPHDCVGSNIYVHTRRQQVLRVVPRENECINETWISDRDRFSYEALYSEERLTKPKIKKGSQWIEVSWASALEYVAKELLDTKEISGPDSIGALISPNATLEECYLLQKLMRGLKTNNIDHRLRQSDFRDQETMPLSPNLGVSIDALEHQSVALLIGSDIRKEQPILSLKLRKMTLSGGKVLVINPVDFVFNLDVAEKCIVTGGDFVLALARVAKAILNGIHTLQKTNTLKVFAEATELLQAVTPTEADLRLAKVLIEGERNSILLGALAISHPEYSQIVMLATLIAELTAAKVGILPSGANSTGAWLAGAVPHRLSGGKPVKDQSGLSASEMYEKGLNAYLLFNMEPDLDCLNGLQALKALQKAKIIIAITPFENKMLQEVSDVLLPITPFTENSGTFVNIEGRWQSFKAVAPPLGDSRPGWKVLRVLGNLCNLAGFEYETAEEIQSQLKSEITPDLFGESKWSTPRKSELFSSQELERKEKNKKDKIRITRIAPVPLYAVDGLVRRAKSLQLTQDAGNASVHLNSRLADSLELIGKNHARVKTKGDDFGVTLSFMIDETVPDNSVVIFAGLKETVSLGAPYAEVEIEGV